MLCVFLSKSLEYPFCLVIDCINAFSLRTFCYMDLQDFLLMQYTNVFCLYCNPLMLQWRLMYGSAVLGVVIPKYHFAIKVTQRRINLLNRFPGIANKEVDLPMKIRAKLGEWSNELVYNRPREALPHPDFAPHKNKLYTDASGKGWGDILYLDTGEVSIVVGGPTGDAKSTRLRRWRFVSH